LHSASFTARLLTKYYIGVGLRSVFQTCLVPCSRLTTLLRTAIQAIGFASTGKAGARLAAKLRMPLSDTTLLWSLHLVPMPVVKEVQSVGIDDWGATRSCMCSCKDSRKEALTWGSAPSALPG